MISSQHDFFSKISAKSDYLKYLGPLINQCIAMLQFDLFPARQDV